MTEEQTLKYAMQDHGSILSKLVEHYIHNGQKTIINVQNAIADWRRKIAANPQHTPESAIEFALADYVPAADAYAAFSSRMDENRKRHAAEAAAKSARDNAARDRAKAEEAERLEREYRASTRYFL